MNTSPGLRVVSSLPLDSADAVAAILDKTWRILIVDDDDVDREWVGSMVARLGPQYLADAVTTLDEAAAALAARHYDCVFVDHDLHGESGNELLALLGQDTPAVLLTQHDSDELIVDAIRRGFADYLPKSRLVLIRLRQVIEQAIARQEQANTRHRAEERLSRLVEELEREHFVLMAEAAEKARGEARAKAMFLANMCHEVRTPLSTVTGLAQLLSRTRLDAEQQGIVGRIDVACKALLAIVNDVLDLSKLGEARIEIETAPVGVAQLCDDLCEIVGPQCEAKGVALECTVDPVLPPTLLADRTRLHQIVLNFLANAAKFTASGTVRLRVGPARLRDGRPAVRFAVEDSGIGIARDDLKRLFEPFTQADASTTRRYGGTGLGLSIARGLAEAMGGSVDAASTIGTGSTFWVDLPLIETGSEWGVVEDLSDRSGKALQGVRLLLVDDCEINLEIAQDLLGQEGAEVLTAANGQEALDLLVRDPDWPQLVLLDLQMPVLGGHDTCRRISAMLGAARPAILIMTAGATGDTQALLNEGLADGLVGKPFALEALARTIASTLERRAGALPAVGACQGRRASCDENSWPELAGIDSALARANFGGDFGLLSLALRKLVDELADMRADDLLSSGEVAAWQLALIRSNAALVGARGMEEAAAAAILAQARHAHVEALACSTRLLAEADTLRADLARHGCAGLQEMAWPGG